MSFGSTKFVPEPRRAGELNCSAKKKKKKQMKARNSKVDKTWRETEAGQLGNVKPFNVS